MLFARYVEQDTIRINIIDSFSILLKNFQLLILTFIQIY